MLLQPSSDSSAGVKAQSWEAEMLALIPVHVGPSRSSPVLLPFSGHWLRVLGRGTPVVFPIVGVEWWEWGMPPALERPVVSIVGGAGSWL